MTNEERQKRKPSRIMQAYLWMVISAALLYSTVLISDHNPAYSWLNRLAIFNGFLFLIVGIGFILKLTFEPTGWQSNKNRWVIRGIALALAPALFVFTYWNHILQALWIR